MANLKRNMIELVQEVKEGEIVTKKYLTPMFLPMRVVYESIDMAAEIDEGAENANEEKELIEKLLSFVADKVYGSQFTRDELFDGLHAPDAIRVLQEQIMFVARGQQSDATKKYLEKKD